MNAAVILETMMIISFGVSWPFAIIRSVRSRSTKGKSLVFMYCIFIGYLCGIAGKLISRSLNLAFWFYIPNAMMVFADLMLYYANRKRESEEA